MVVSKLLLHTEGAISPFRKGIFQKVKVKNAHYTLELQNRAGKKRLMLLTEGKE